MQTDRHTLARQGFEFTGGLGGGQPRRDGFPHARLQGGRRTRGTPRRRDQPFGRFPKGCHVRLHHSLHIGGQVGSNNELGQGLAKGLVGILGQQLDLFFKVGLEGKFQLRPQGTCHLRGNRVTTGRCRLFALIHCGLERRRGKLSKVSDTNGEAIFVATLLMDRLDGIGGELTCERTHDARRGQIGSVEWYHCSTCSFARR
mmetsp:Transcript_4666/g.9401  ORF Transcript_4666/g.9401 Transcript_4666/m.9401 type:complete len:201 (-) Transcript_4666:147-749(-)